MEDAKMKKLRKLFNFLNTSQKLTLLVFLGKSTFKFSQKILLFAEQMKSSKSCQKIQK